MKINSGETALETVDFSVFRATASVHHSSTSAGYDAKLVLVDDSVTLRLAGTGVQVGKKRGICVFDNCFGVDFGRLFG